MKATTTVLQEAAELEAAIDKLNAKHAEKHAATIAKFSPESVALYRRLQSEKAKAAEGKAS